MSEHECPACGVLHEGDETNEGVWALRCVSCGALNHATQGPVSKAICRVCLKVGDLVAIGDAVRFYPYLTKTDRGYEYVRPPDEEQAS